ncbi:hypothetical protein DB88DRAFT_472213 [Papiliotrema laurentii]|uniref:Uncharacterized protein n=1 Tax=Papiliotrema laurentii TaxID=5418 RepID=A0AAD9L6U1_PAPLA|nr:hypothetical protein DB88DRAFT_472213 [Papiliotrema laurentii]
MTLLPWGSSAERGGSRGGGGGYGIHESRHGLSFDRWIEANMAKGGMMEWNDVQCDSYLFFPPPSFFISQHISTSCSTALVPSSPRNPIPAKCSRREMELMVGTGPFSDCIPHRRPRGNSNWATQVGAGLKPELLPLPGHRAPDSDGRGGRNPKRTTAHPAALVTSIRASYTWKNPSPSRAGQQMSKRKTLPLAHLRHILPSEGGNRTPRSLAALKDTLRNEASSP